MIQYYSVKDAATFLKDGEQEILSMKIGPIPRHRYYLFICFKKDNEYRMRILNSNTNEFLIFVREYIEEANLDKPSLKDFCENKNCIEAYTDTFGNDCCISDKRFFELLENAESLEAEEDIYVVGGLDGFSLGYHSPKQTGVIRLWCFIEDKNKYYKPCIDLANYLMDMAGIAEKDYRFGIYKRRNIYE